jgi:hypothetical protein
VFTLNRGSPQGDREPKGRIWTRIRGRLRRWFWKLALAAGTGVAFGVTMAVSEELDKFCVQCSGGSVCSPLQDGPAGSSPTGMTKRGLFLLPDAAVPHGVKGSPIVQRVGAED